MGKWDHMKELINCTRVKYYNFKNNLVEIITNLENKHISCIKTSKNKVKKTQKT